MKSFANLKIEDNTYLLVAIFLLAIIISVLSFFKSKILNEFGFTLTDYWAVRLFIIVIFIKIVCKNRVNKIVGDKKEVNFSKTSYDGLLNVRALAILCVLLGHWYAVTFPPMNLVQKVKSGEFVWLLTGAANAGVWVFFSLSGYLMGKGFFSSRYSYDGMGVFNYFVGRLFKIYPIYIVSIVIVGILVEPRIFNLSDIAYLDNFLSLIFFDMPRLGPIGALWSVTAEVQFYCLVPPLCFFMSKFLTTAKRSYIFLLFLSAGAFLIKFYMLKKYGMEIWVDYIYFPTIANLDCFMFGMVSALLINKHGNFMFNLRNKESDNFGLILIILFYLFMSFITAKVLINDTADFNRPFMLRGTVYFSLMPIIVSLLTSLLINYYEQIKDLNNIPNLPSKVLKRIGILAFVLYVWHSPIYLSLRTLYPEKISIYESVEYMIFMIPILYFIASFAYQMIELPLNKFGQNYKINAVKSLPSTYHK